MIVHLCIPHRMPDGTTHPRKGHQTHKLRWTNHHPMSRYGLGVLLDVKGEVFDGNQFRHLRRAVGAWLESGDDTSVIAALGLPPGEGIGRPDSDPLPAELSVPLAAATLALTEGRVRQQLAAGVFPAARKVGRDWVIPLADVEAAKGRKMKPGPAARIES